MTRALLAVLALLVAGASAGGCGGEERRLGTSPYVQDVTPSSAVVAAVTDGAARLRLRWGAPEGELDGVVEETEPVQVHGLRATGLAPGAEYRYVLETVDGAALGEATFRTAPPRDAARVDFLAIGDSGGVEDDDGPVLQDAEEVVERLEGTAGDEDQQAKVVAAMLGRPADLVLHLGDIVYPAGRREDYPAAYFRPFAPLIARVPVYPTMGNHDAKTDGGAPLLEVFFLPENGVEPDGRTYSFDWANVHFTCLDSVTSAYDPGSAQAAWFDRDLAATDRAWKVVWFHVPAFSASRAGDNGALQEALAPLFAKHRVDLVLTGHDHAYVRFFPVDGVTYVVSGGGGKSLYPVRDDPRVAHAESVFQFVHVSVDGDDMRIVAVDAAGHELDAVTIRKAER